MPKLTYGLAVFGLGILGALIFGVAIALATAHASLEYFVGRPAEGSPVGVGVVRGLASSWHVGAIFGGLAGLLGSVGAMPMLPLRRVIRSLVTGLIAIFLLSILTLVCSYVAVLTMAVDTPNRTPEFLAVRATHAFSYFAGAIMGLVTCIWIWRTRALIDPHLPPWVER